MVDLPMGLTGSAAPPEYVGAFASAEGSTSGSGHALPAIRDLFTNSTTTAHDVDAAAQAITPIWLGALTAGRLREALDLWPNQLEAILSCEREFTTVVHKGSFYYYAGCTEILVGALDRGFLLMHEALSEDARRGTGRTAARQFVELDDTSSDQLFGGWVRDRVAQLDGKLTAFNRLSPPPMSVTEFYNRLRAKPAPIECLYLLTYSLARLSTIERTLPIAGNESEFKATLQSSVIFDFCRVADEMIKTTAQVGVWRFIDLAAHLSSAAGLALSTAELGLLNAAFQTDFSTTLGDLLDGNYNLSGRRIIGLERDVAICYGFRNLAAHRVPTHAMICRRFDESVTAVLNTIFLTVQKLY